MGELATEMDAAKDSRGLDFELKKAMALDTDGFRWRPGFELWKMNLEGQQHRRN